MIKENTLWVLFTHIHQIWLTEHQFVPPNLYDEILYNHHCDRQVYWPPLAFPSIKWVYVPHPLELPWCWWLSGKESSCKAGEARDMDSIPGSGISPGGGHGNPLRYSCLENTMDRGAWWTTVHRVAKSQDLATKQPQVYVLKKILEDIQKLLMVIFLRCGT